MKRLFKKKKDVFDGDGLVLFASTSEAMKAENVLRKAGVAVKLVAPPPARRKGCDLAIEVNLMERVSVERCLSENDLFRQSVRLPARKRPFPRRVRSVEFLERPAA